MHLAHPDWLYHRLHVSGPASDLITFREAAAGAGVVPWQYDYDRFAEDWFHRLITHCPRDSLPLSAAHKLAAQLRDAVWHEHETALAWIGRARGCVFDLHALAPVPPALLARGPDDPDSLTWLWSHWGTTWPLRHVKPLTVRGSTDGFTCEFWAADWSPWPVIASLRARFPVLRFDLQARY